MDMIYTESALLECLQKGEKTSRVYLYGAGNVGSIVLQRLRRYGVMVAGFLESEPQKREKDNIPVVSLETIPYGDDVIIVISTAEALHDEINARLGEFRTVVAVSNKLANNMRRIIEKRLHFEAHIVEHCNLNCRGCYHFSPLAKEEYLSVEDFAADCERLGNLFHGEMEQITLLGGEPLLHPHVADFFRVVRTCFPKGSIHILTNGLLLLHMGKDFYDALKETESELWVTKYNVAFDYGKAEDIILHTYNVKLNYFNTEPVRTLGHQPLDISGNQDAAYNFHHCYRANCCVDLKHGKLYPCIIPAEIKPFCEYFKIDIPIAEEDYVDIYKVRSVEELLERLEQPIPFCRYCNREAAEVFGVREWERTSYNMNEWTD